MELLPPLKHRGFLAYAGGELTFWIVLALSGGALTCAANQRYVLSYTLAGGAAFFVFIWLYRARENAKPGRRLLFCAKCKYYRMPERIEEGRGAI